MSSSTLRGSLRRAAAEVIWERAEASGYQPTVHDHMFWAAGGNRGSAKDGATNIKIRHEAIAANRVLAAFGAGVCPGGGMAQAGLWLRHATPRNPDDIKVDIILGARGAEESSDFLVGRLTDADLENLHSCTVLGRDYRELKAQAKVATGDTKKALEKRMEDLSAQIDELGGSDNSTVMPLSGYEVMAAGTELDHRMDLHFMTREEIGLVLDALDRFSDAPFVGAHRSAGCGLISFDYDSIECRKAGVRTIEKIGSLKLSERHADSGGLEIKSEFLAGCLEAWRAETFEPAVYSAKTLARPKADASEPKPRGRKAA